MLVLWSDQMHQNINTNQGGFKKCAGHHLCSLYLDDSRLALLSSDKSAILKGSFIKFTKRSMNWPEKYILTQFVKYLAYQKAQR